MYGARGGLALPDWPVPTTKGNPITVKDAIEDLNFYNPRSSGEDSNVSSDDSGFTSYVRPEMLTPYAEALVTPSRIWILNHATGKDLEWGENIEAKKIEFDSPANTITATVSNRRQCLHPG